MIPMLKDRIEGVLLDTDEDGFHLVFSGEHAEYDFTFDPEATSALFAAVAEMQRPAWPVPRIPGGPVGELFGAYEPDDPKSEGYHDRMSGIWDDREKT